MCKYKINWFQIIKIFFIISIIIAIFKFVVPIFSPSELREIIEKVGIWGPIIVILYCVAAHVVAPLVGSPIFLASIVIYGVWRTAIFYYIASLISATINFYISRRLGRPWVKKIGGTKILNQTDKIVNKLGDKILIFCRLFGWSLFDVISYAAGLTKISFKRYFFITATFSLIPIFGFVLLFRNMEISLKMILLYVGMVAIIAGFLF